jgi:hydroxypyruvate reductase
MMGINDRRAAAQVQRGDRPVRLVRSHAVASLTGTLSRLREHLHHILRGGLSAIEPARLLAHAAASGLLDRLNTPGTTDSGSPTVTVIAAGKAAWPMAHAFAWLDRAVVDRGMIAGPRVGEVPDAGQLEWYEGGHPVPNDASVAAGRRALELAGEAGDRYVVVLMSGGASSMMAVPAPGVTMTDKVETTRTLLAAGVPIGQLNCVRKHLSGIKGGWLAAAAERSLTLAISDVHSPVADDPSIIGSGPTVADPSTFADALRIVREVSGVPAAVRRYLERGVRGEIRETVSPRIRARHMRPTIIGNRQTALSGASRVAAALGYSVVVLEPPTEGEARRHPGVRRPRTSGSGVGRAAAMCAGCGRIDGHGQGKGQGGRNQEFALPPRPSWVSSVGPRICERRHRRRGWADGCGRRAVDSSTLERAERPASTGNHRSRTTTRIISSNPWET